MISSLNGKLGGIGPTWVDVAVNGVGLRVQVPGQTLSTLGSSMGSDVLLPTFMVVREDALDLYGFGSEKERETFEILMTVKGVGPKLALAAIDAIGVSELARSVQDEDLKTLQRIPGVGKKTAQRLVLEIGDKLGPPDVDVPVAQASPATNANAEAVTAALEQLGWPRAVAVRVVDSLEGDFTTMEEMLRAALAQLGAKHGL